MHSLTNAPWSPKARSLKIEIALAFSVVIVLMFALGVAFYLSDQRSASALDKLLKTDGRMSDLSLRSAQALLRAHAAESEFLLSVDRLGLAEARERHVLPMQSHLLDMREYLTSFRILSSDPSLLDKIGQIEEQTQHYEEGFLAFVDQYDKAHKANAASKTRQPYVAAALAIEPLLEDLHTTATKRALLTRSGVESAATITRWTVFITVAIAALLGSLVAVIVWRRITGSVMQLITFSERVAAGDLSARAPQNNEREFAILAHAMNQMAQSLENSQAQLLSAARLAGMAEIATNVLHNVGNVLNSVNVSANLVSTQLRASKLNGLARAVRLLDEHAGDLGDFLARDPRGKLLPGYLRELAQTLEAEHAAMADELRALGKSVDHIKEVVATQQSYAGTPRFVETLKLDELVGDALRMNTEALMRHKVNVVTNLAELPALPLDRNRVLQILVNLISNAKQAVNGVSDKDPCITLGADLVDGRVLHITVADNGEGIASENLTRVFAHGFTTRKDGHGFGLHSCILAAQEMGGCLRAHSNGPGQGAIFTLEIPVDSTEGRR
jgi:signal transduction histidine kinase